MIKSCSTPHLSPTAFSTPMYLASSCPNSGYSMYYGGNGGGGCVLAKGEVDGGSYVGFSLTLDFLRFKVYERHRWWRQSVKEEDDFHRIRIRKIKENDELHDSIVSILKLSPSTKRDKG
ncbi:hypothetical protein M8C21_012646 [Ambrosia artemisiifolia]|uniref:Uncharacterized protein n=1 Tax=Ambrosia artemisiifolia TaxID=4212 RepID=A0AAD5C7J2_AMBAR|nr:hypothetical protein M8C21_012646 [Ambrosia artemisiifolia]